MRVLDIRDVANRYGDTVLALGLTALLVIEYAADESFSTAELAVGCAVAVVIGALVAVRVRAPLALLLATTLAVVGRGLLPAGGDGVAWGVVAMLAVYTAAAHTDGWRVWAGLGLSLATTLGIMAYDGGNWNLGGVLFFGLLVGAPWVFGRVIRQRRARETALETRTAALERDREDEIRRAVETERTRIARELHDVVGHALGVIVVQADGGRRLLASDPAQTSGRCRPSSRRAARR